MSEMPALKKEETKEPIRISLIFDHNEDSPDANEIAGMPCAPDLSRAYQRVAFAPSLCRHEPAE